MSKASKLNRSNNNDYIKKISKDYYSLNFTGGFTQGSDSSSAAKTKNLVYIKTSGATKSNNVTNYDVNYKCDEIITGSIRRNEPSDLTTPDDAYIQLKVGKYYNIRVDVFDHSHDISSGGHNRFVYLQGDAIPGGSNDGDSTTLLDKYTIAAFQDTDAGTMDAELSTVIKAEGTKLYILSINRSNQVFMNDNVVVSIIIQEL